MLGLGFLEQQLRQLGLRTALAGDAPPYSQEGSLQASSQQPSAFAKPHGGRPSLCAGLVGPEGRDVVHALQAVRVPCAPREPAAEVDILNLHGKLELKAQVCCPVPWGGPDEPSSRSQQPIVATLRSFDSEAMVESLRSLRSFDSEAVEVGGLARSSKSSQLLGSSDDSSILAVCRAATTSDGRLLVNIFGADGELFGCLMRDVGPRYTLLHRDGSGQVYFDGAFQERIVKVTAQRERLADTEPYDRALDPQGKFYRLRVAPAVDAGLVLLCLLSIDAMEAKTSMHLVDDAELQARGGGASVPGRPREAGRKETASTCPPASQLGSSQSNSPMNSAQDSCQPPPPLCPEFVCPDGCLLLMPWLTQERGEGKVCIAIDDARGTPVLQATFEPGQGLHSNVRRLALLRPSGETAFAFCRDGKEPRSLTVHRHEDEELFGTLSSCSSQSGGAYLLRRRGGARIAFGGHQRVRATDQHGRLLATAEPAADRPGRRSVRIGPEVDSGLIVLCMLGINFLEQSVGVN